MNVSDIFFDSSAVFKFCHIHTNAIYSGYCDFVLGWWTMWLATFVSKLFSTSRVAENFCVLKGFPFHTTSCLQSGKRFSSFRYLTACLPEKLFFAVDQASLHQMLWESIDPLPQLWSCAIWQTLFQNCQRIAARGSDRCSSDVGSNIMFKEGGWTTNTYFPGMHFIELSIYSSRYGFMAISPSWSRCIFYPCATFDAGYGGEAAFSDMVEKNHCWKFP